MIATLYLRISNYGFQHMSMLSVQSAEEYLRAVLFSSFFFEYFSRIKLITAMSWSHVHASGPPTPTSVPIQCAWCSRWGRFYFDPTQNQAGNAFGNWLQTRVINPTCIVCDICNFRGRPPHSDYLYRVTNGMLDKMMTSYVAEFAYGVYTRNSPTVLAANSGPVAALPGYQVASTSGSSSSDSRGTTWARTLADSYFSSLESRSAVIISTGEKIRLLRNWLDTGCPICDAWNTTCHHPRPQFQVGGMRGITVSFNTTSPNLQSLGMSPHCLHSGLRPVIEAIIRREGGRHEDLFLELDHTDALQAREISDDDEGTEGSQADALIEARMRARARFLRRDPSINDPECPYTLAAIAAARVGMEVTDGPVAQKLCQNCGRPTGYGNRPTVCRRCQRTGMCLGCANEGAFVDDPICYPCQFGFRNNL